MAAAGKDRSLFAQMLVLLREAGERQPDVDDRAAFRESSLTIIGAGGQSHMMTHRGMRPFRSFSSSALKPPRSATAIAPISRIIAS